MNRVRSKWTLLFLFSLLSCSKIYEPAAPASDQPVIGYGTSFGECMGYCKTELSIDNALASLVVSSWQPKKDPDESASERLPANEWTALIQAVNWDEFKQQPDVIGCPDCADGGAEWISIRMGLEVKKITFEFGRFIKGHENLLQQLRAIHERMRKNF